MPATSKLFLQAFVTLVSGTAVLHAQAVTTPAATNLPGDPRFYFYNPRLDAVGQKVEAAAGEIANGQIFDTQLENLKAVSKLATDRIFSSGRRAALARLEGARDWASLHNFAKRAQEKALLSSQEAAEWKKKVEELKAQITATDASAAHAGVSLKAVADLLEDVGSAREIIQFGTFLSERQVANVSKTDLRVIGKIQET
ncbi:MAG: hypothetical protein WKF37_21540 [Bryobacteraceae bacterium]